MKNKFFSVVLTTYNRGPLLIRALKSLMNQTETDWEVILVNDGSNDDTDQLIQEYLAQFPGKISYVKQENQGTVKAKNIGLALATGTFVTFLDSDDEYHPEHLEIRKRFLQRHPELQFLYGGVQVIGNQYVPDRHQPTQRIHLSNCVIGGTFFLTRKLALSLGGFRPFPIGTDADLFERIKEREIDMMKIEDPTYVYHRESEDSITHKFSKESEQELA